MTYQIERERLICAVGTPANMCFDPGRILTLAFLLENCQGSSRTDTLPAGTGGGSLSGASFQEPIKMTAK
jgi:hypothetical protein